MCWMMLRNESVEPLSVREMEEEGCGSGEGGSHGEGRGD